LAKKIGKEFLPQTKRNKIIAIWKKGILEQSVTRSIAATVLLFPAVIATIAVRLVLKTNVLKGNNLYFKYCFIRELYK
jgi:hypothetical protein